MLICPQCQFENPNTNKFCQRCGTSLTQKVCPECGTEVALNEKRCHNCDAMTATIWWAIIAKEEPYPLPTREEQAESGTEVKEGITPLLLHKSSSVNSQLSVGAYLDPEQRYQLLEPLPPLEEIAPSTEVYVRVLDCQPFQMSPLMAMVANRQQSSQAPSPTAKDDLMMAIGIPPIAKAYVALQSQSHEALPTIHDAWQHEGLQVILIEDRSDWPSLLNLWKEDQTTSLQIIHWFYKMTQLWGALEPWQCRQSLLELSNLRLDEDQALALQRLYVEPVNSLPNGESSAVTPASNEQPLTLKDLGRVWHTLFQQSQRTQFGSLVQLLGDVEVGNIETVAELRSRLEEIAGEMEGNLSSTDPTSGEETTLNHQEFTATSGEDTATPSQSSATFLQVDEEDNSSSARISDDMPTIVLPMQLMSLEDAGRTDVGTQRHHNEDYFGIETKINKLEFPNSRSVQARGLYILCDGMGGHAGGEIASTLAVKTVRQYFQGHWNYSQLPNEDSIREAVRLANHAIYDVNQKDSRAGIGRMGTTLVMVLIQDTQVAVAHVGDSRLYRVTRKRGLEQITVDHEVGQREIFRGVEPGIAYARPDAYQLTQALGPRDENFINPDVQFFELNEDTLLLLASDGLSDNDLLEHHWQTHLEPLLSSRANLERGIGDLIDLANQYNGHDNITAVLIRAKVRPNLEQQR